MMNLFDDTLPEESEPQYKELTTLLQQAYSKPASVTPDRQAQILARVRERLEITDADEGVVSQDSIDIVQFGAPPPREVPRQHRLSRLVSSIAAVLVVVMFISAALLIFQPPTPPASRPVGTPTTDNIQTDGLDMSVQITPGPYFLTEMVELDLSITNHTHILQRLFSLSLCPIKIVLAGGESPIDTDLQHFWETFPCIGGDLNESLLQPGQTITLQRFVLLARSGQITLTTQFSSSVFETASGVQNSQRIDAHFPPLHLSVNPQIPSNRHISLQTQSAQGVYMSLSTCNRPKETPSYVFALHTFSEPGGPENCSSGGKLSWTVVIGVPGYAVVLRKYA